MATTFVAYDKRSGAILSVHLGAVDEKEVRKGVQSRAQYPGQQDAKISDEHVAVITVPSNAAESGKQYKVDLKRKVLVETKDREGGVGFGFGKTGRST
jgi:hypothetical protein